MILTVFSVLLPAPVGAAGLLVQPAHERYDMSPWLLILENADETLTLEDILTPARQTGFRANSQGTPNFGLTDHVIWLKFEIQAESLHQSYLLELANPLLDKVDFYAEEHGKFTVKKSGNLHTFENRDMRYKNVVFKLHFPENHSKVFYLRVQSRYPLHIPVILWTQDAFTEKVSEEQYRYGIFYGAPLMMIFYHLFIFFVVKDWSYMYYVLALVFGGLVNSIYNGLAFEYLGSFIPEWALAFPLAVTIYGFCSVLFVKSFLDTRKHLPRWNSVLNGMMLVLALESCLPWILHIHLVLKIYALFALVAVVIVLAVGVLSWLKGVRTAYYFLLSTIVLMLGIILFTLKSVGLLPSTFWTEHSAQIGGLIQLLLLSFGLADRINQMRDATAKAQEESIRIKDQMAEKLQQKNQELMEMDQLKDEFLANTSHELLTPLHGIVGIAESMADGATGPITAQQMKNLAMIVASGRRLSTLIYDLLDFSKMKHGTLELQWQVVDLKNLASMVLNICQPLVGHKPVELRLDIPEQLPLLQADESRLQQILFNLVGNAIKFTSQGHVTIRARLKQGKTRLEVDDSGIGIPKDRQQVIFNAFQQADGSISRQFGGTGLGLTISQMLVSLHGSSISLESMEGKGSIFSFDLPVSGTSEAVSTEKLVTSRYPVFQDVSAEISSEILPLTMIPSRTEIIVSEGRKILVVDDDRTNLMVLKNQLGLKGFEIFLAEDGFDALEILEDTLPDLILLDLMMPRMSGYEVCGKIRERYDLYELPIIILTAKNQVTDLVHALNVGANDYLPKPFHKEELYARIQTLLKARDGVVQLRENVRLRQEIQRREEIEHELRISHTKLLRVLDHFDEAIVVTDPEGRVSFFNQRAESLWNHPVQKVISQPLELLFGQEFMDSLSRQILQPLASIDDGSDMKWFTLTQIGHGAQTSSLFVLLSIFPCQHSWTMTFIVKMLSQQKIEALALNVNEWKIFEVSSMDLLFGNELNTLGNTQEQQKLLSLESAVENIAAVQGMASFDEVVQLRHVVPGLDDLDFRQSPAISWDNINELLVEIMNMTINAWEMTGQTRIDLAEKSGIWRASVDGSTWRTRTLDKYLSVKTLPQSPKWQKVIETARFVLEHVESAPEIRKLLEEKTQQLQTLLLHTRKS
ncbi:MAG: response regulator [SAR324 cluster bacterium]|nr:response regulator [SAR324 cluster bacterium]